MTVKEFLEIYNYAPYDDVELAEIACQVEGGLGKIAEKYLNALKDFDYSLDEIGYERG